MNARTGLRKGGVEAIAFKRCLCELCPFAGGINVMNRARNTVSGITTVTISLILTAMALAVYYPRHQAPPILLIAYVINTESLLRIELICWTCVCLSLLIAKKIGLTWAIVSIGIVLLSYSYVLYLGMRLNE